MKISVIIPVYNAARYLKKCMNSVINQTYKNLEIIVIDDGSTDASSTICDKYAAMDKRVQVIHRENKGLVSARKFGVSLASGDYIAFADSDDWIEIDMYEKLSQEVFRNDSDIVASGYIYETDYPVRILNSIAAGFYQGADLEQKVYPYMLYSGVEYEFGLTQFMWNKLYRRPVIEMGIRDVDERITDGEDVAIFFPTALSAESISVVSGCFYHYREIKTSMSRKKSSEYYENAMHLNQYLEKIFLNSKYREIMMPQLRAFMFRFVCNGLKPLFHLELERGYLWDLQFEGINGLDEVVLYGAGNIGCSYYEQIRKYGQIKLVAWVDKNKVGQIIFNGQVEAQDFLLHHDYDKILLAVNNEKKALEIIRELKALGIEGNRIVWREPQRFWGELTLKKQD